MTDHAYSLVSIDPGRDHVAAAFWDDGLLRRCLLFEAPGDHDLGLVVSAQLNEVRHSDAWARLSCNHAVIEYMCHRPGQAASQARDLIDVSIAGVAVAAKIADSISFVPAAQWKGQAPKAVIQKRIMERLSESEAAALAACLTETKRGRHHDVYDAVGIGLHYLRRM